MADDGKEPKDDPFADDDDDDDEEAPAEGEEEAAKKGVPMVGDVTLQDGRLFWAGSVGRLGGGPRGGQGQEV